jgi:D-3-phosphoglycerate dehydrogenase
MRILATSVIAQEAIERLREKHEVDVIEYSPDKLLDAIPKYDVLIVRSAFRVTREVIDHGTNLKVIAVAGVGLDKINIEYATAKKIVVVNAPRGSTDSVAELTIGLMIAISRRIPEADTSMREGRWDKNKLKGFELYGKTLGLVGFGKIGREVGRRAASFGMQVVVYDPFISIEKVRAEGFLLLDFDELLTVSDYVSIHAMLTVKTSGMMDYGKFATMKRSAFIINASRGAIIKEADLVRALEEDLIAGAALDVFEDEPLQDSPLRKFKNVIMTPHIAGSTYEAQIRAGMSIANDIIKALSGERPEFIVNKDIFPHRVV